MSTPTQRQVDVLLNFLLEHRDLACGKLRNTDGRKLAASLWADITKTLNAMEGTNKTSKQWQRIWSDKKYHAKRAFALAKKSSTGSGDGSSLMSHLSAVDHKVLAIIGLDGAQAEARVPAFPQESRVLTPQASSETDTSENLQPESHNLPGPSQTSTFQRSPRSPLLHGDFENALIELEHERAEREKSIISELAGIKGALLELCSLIRRIVERQL